MFSSLMPQRRQFFELLAADSERVVAGANATLRLINGLGAGTEDTPVLVAEVNLNEQAADKIKAQLIALLHRSFTTPLNRDQIHTLTIELDLVLNALQDVANAAGMYNIRESTVEAREMAALAADACMRLNRAVVALADKRNKETMGLCREIDAIKMRNFHFRQAKVLSRCRRVVRTIEEVVLENP